MASPSSVTDPIAAAPATAAAEWRAHWHQPFIGLIGLSGSAIFTYSAGVLMVPMTRELGWSRAQFALGLTIWSMLGLVTAPVVGQLIDRIGPRRIAITGVPVSIAYCAALGTVDSTIWHWWVLCGGLALVLPMLSPAVWVTAVARRFRAGRGLAFALTLAGTGLAAAIWPVVAAFYVTAVGWRLTLAAAALSWGALAFPLVVLFFARGEGLPRALRRTAPDPAHEAARLGDIVRSRTFLLLAVSGSLFAMLTLAMTIHMVPVLGGKGIPLVVAAATAGVIGLCSMAGRIATGFLLGRLPVALVGGVGMLAPAAAALLLLFGQGEANALVAVVILGLAHGAELDVITFIAARRFAPARFAGLYSLLISLFTAAASVGPSLAGWIYDRTGGYAAFLIATLPLFATASAMIVFAEPRGQRVSRTDG